MYLRSLLRSVKPMKMVMRPHSRKSLAASYRGSALKDSLPISDNCILSDSTHMPWRWSSQRRVFALRDNQQPCSHIKQHKVDVGSHELPPSRSRCFPTTCSFLSSSNRLRRVPSFECCKVHALLRERDSVSVHHVLEVSAHAPQLAKGLLVDNILA